MDLLIIGLVAMVIGLLAYRVNTELDDFCDGFSILGSVIVAIAMLGLFYNHFIEETYKYDYGYKELIKQELIESERRIERIRKQLYEEELEYYKNKNKNKEVCP